MSSLQSPTRHGRFFEVDTRLRPFGRDGSAATAFGEIARYYHHDARLWELAALTCARPVAGNAELGEKFLSLKREVLMRPIDVEALRAHFRTLFEETCRAKTITDQVSTAQDPKYSRGGLFAIDQLIQFFKLVHARDDSEVLDEDLARALGALVRVGAFDDDTRKTLSSARRHCLLRLAYQRLVGHSSHGVVKPRREVETMDKLDAQIRRLYNDTLPLGLAG